MSGIFIMNTAHKREPLTENDPVEARVKEMLCLRRVYMAESKMLTICLSELPNATGSANAARLKQLQKWLAVIDIWLLLLSEDEAFVVKRHLIDGIDWPRVTLEYERIWGAAYAKAERTLRSYQKSALDKIVTFTDEYTGMLV